MHDKHANLKSKFSSLRDAFCVSSYASCVLYLIEVSLQLDNRAMPDEFLRDDILVDGRRQLVLAANAQLEHLGRASKWYFLGKYT